MFGEDDATSVGASHEAEVIAASRPMGVMAA
jgi:hypothetical protein